MNTPHQRHGVLPPYILDQLARNGTEQDAERVARHRVLNRSIRAARALAPLIAVAPPEQVTGPTEDRTISDAQTGDDLPGATVRTEGGPAVEDASVNEAYDGLGATFDFYWKVYGRNSIDGNGLPLDASVHYQRGYDNAFWDGQRMIFGDGDGTYFNRFTISVDVIGHELTHGVTGSERNLAYEGQSGALNESVSDVFGSLVKQYSATPQQTADQADWLIGAGLFTGRVKAVALRSMKAPGTAYDDPMIGKDPQPATMAAYVTTTEDEGGVHTNSGIPNRAFYLAAVAFGGYAWEKAGRIWYETIRDADLPSDATFEQFAAVTVAQAGKLFDADAASTVAAAWNQVGVTATVDA